MSTKQYLGLIGFAFVATAVGFNFGWAVLCLVVGAIFYGAGSILVGETDVGELQDRLRARSGGGGGAVPPASAPPTAGPTVGARRRVR